MVSPEPCRRASKKDKMLVVRMTEQEWQELKVYAETEDCKGGGSDKKAFTKVALF